ncbi:MAG: hypothetical protein WD468_04410 [Pirellulales bacterium]
MTRWGNVLDKLDEVPAAREQHEKGLENHKKLVNENPGLPQYQIGLGGEYDDLGDVTRRKGEYERAIAWYDRAQEVLNAVLAKTPADKKALDYLQTALQGRAESLEKLGRKNESAAEREKAAKMASELKMIGRNTSNNSITPFPSAGNSNRRGDRGIQTPTSANGGNFATMWPAMRKLLESN